MRGRRLSRLGLRKTIALVVWLAVVGAMLLTSTLAVKALEEAERTEAGNRFSERFQAQKTVFEENRSANQIHAAAQRRFGSASLVQVTRDGSDLTGLGRPDWAECSRAEAMAAWGAEDQPPEIVTGTQCDGQSVSMVMKPRDSTLLVLTTSVRGPDYSNARQLEHQLRIMTAVGSLLAALAAWLIAGLVARPVRDAGRAASRFASGDLSARLTVSGQDDLAVMAEQFNTMADQVSQTLELQRQFVSDTAHELRTPTAALLAASSALEAPETRDRAAVMVAPQLRRLSSLTEDLLSLARFDNDREVLRRELIDLVGLARATVKGQGVTVRATRPQREVRLDVIRVQTIMRNLVTNALKYGRRPITLSLDLRSDPVVITVTDEGEGVPEPLRATLFERFVRGDSARSVGGTGLGLAIAHEQTRLHGGHLSLDDDGRTFRAVLPETDSVPESPITPTSRADSQLAHRTRWVLAAFVLGLSTVVLGLVVWGTRLSWENVVLASVITGSALLLWSMLAKGLALAPRWVAPVIAVTLVMLAGVLAWSQVRWWPLYLLLLPMAGLLGIDRRLRRG